MSINVFMMVKCLEGMRFLGINVLRESFFVWSVFVLINCVDVNGWVNLLNYKIMILNVFF